MHSVQIDVMDFHAALDIPIRDIGSVVQIDRPDLRANLIMEEACETASALLGREIGWSQAQVIDPVAPDVVKTIDGLCDLLCVVYGTAVEMGIDLAPFWDEVHCSNMEKKGGPVRGDGKILKPEGWSSPQIEAILAKVSHD